MAPVVVVRPLSGYANRLQAIVSAQLLAAEIQAEFWVDWEPSDVAPVPMDAVMDPAFCRVHARRRSFILNALGVDPAKIEPYLHLDNARGIVTLAGLDLGEQHFMPDLSRMLSRTPDVHAIVISAGGKFTLSGDSRLTPQQECDFRSARWNAYQRMLFHPEIEDAAEALMQQHPSFMALHLRYSDRSRSSPWRWQIDRALREVASRSDASEIFLASDSFRERQFWLEKVAGLGLTPWTVASLETQRSDPRAAHGALVDWRILSRSAAMVYFSASSFAEEALVASGAFNQSIGLAASAPRRAWMVTRQLADAARTYPDRHGWLTTR